jgi:hypothetical protein
MGNTNTVLYILVLIVTVIILLLCWATQRKLKTLEWFMVDIYDAVTAPIVVIPDATTPELTAEEQAALDQAAIDEAMAAEAAAAEAAAADQAAADAAAADAAAGTTDPVGATSTFTNKKLPTVLTRPAASKLKASGEQCNRIFGPSKVANVECGIDAKHVGAGAPLNQSGEMCNRIFGPHSVVNTTCGITASLNNAAAPLPKPHVGAALPKPHVGAELPMPAPLSGHSASGVPSINQSIMSNYRSDRVVHSGSLHQSSRNGYIGMTDATLTSICGKDNY